MWIKRSTYESLVVENEKLKQLKPFEKAAFVMNNAKAEASAVTYKGKDYMLITENYFGELVKENYKKGAKR